MTDVAFEKEYEALHRLALARARRVVGSDSDAEEIAQETMLRAYSSWPKVSTYAEAWTTRVATNLAISHLRRQARQIVAAVAVHANEYDSTRVDVVAALEALPPRQRQIAVLRHVADLPEKEVATSLGISVGAVKRHLHRATTTLKSSEELAVYNRAAEFRQQAITHRRWLVENMIAAPEPPSGWPPPPWDTVAVLEGGYVRYRAVDQDGNLILDAGGREVVFRHDCGYGFYQPFAHDHRTLSTVPWDKSLDDAAQETVRRAVVIAERFGAAFAAEGELGIAVAECLSDVKPLSRDLLLRGRALEGDGPHAAARLALFAEREAAGWRRGPAEDRLPVSGVGFSGVLKHAATVAARRGKRVTVRDLLDALVLPWDQPRPPPPPAVVALMGYGRTNQPPKSTLDELDAIIDGTSRHIPR